MPHVLERATVLDPDGRDVRLGTLWAERTAVLVFVRHFGCIFCRQQVAEIGPIGQRVESLGAHVVVIGHGTLDETRAFIDEVRPAVRVLTDPTRQAYCALEMRRDRRSVLGMRVLARALRAWRRGFRQRRVAGDPFQQGGVVVVTPSGDERYRYVSQHAGDHPPALDILTAVVKGLEGPKSTAPGA